MHAVLSTKRFFANGREPTHVNSSRAECRLRKRYNVANLNRFTPPPPPPPHFYCFPPPFTTTFLLFPSTITTFLFFPPPPPPNFYHFYHHHISVFPSKSFCKRREITTISSVCSGVSSSEEKPRFSSTVRCFRGIQRKFLLKALNTRFRLSNVLLDL